MINTFTGNDQNQVNFLVFAHAWRPSARSAGTPVPGVPQDRNE